MGEPHLAVVGDPGDDRPRTQGARLTGIAQGFQQAPDLLVDELLEVGVEVHVIELRPARAQRADVGDLPELHQRMNARLLGERLVDRGGQRHVEMAKVLAPIAACPERVGVAEHVVGVDERDDQAERLGQVLLPEEALDLADVVLVPAHSRPPSGAAAEMAGFDVLARVGRLPATEAEVALRSARRRLAPVVPAGQRRREVPLALVDDGVAGLSQARPQRRDLGRELRLPAAVRPKPQQSAKEGSGETGAGNVPVRGKAGHLPDHRGEMAPGSASGRRS